jgi:hypothetical protein
LVDKHFKQAIGNVCYIRKIPFVLPHIWDFFVLKNNMTKQIFIEDDGKEAGILIDESVVSFRTDRLIAVKCIISCIDANAFEKILSLKDRKGTLFVSWRSMPTIQMLLSVKKAWEILNEDSVENDYYGESLINY